MTTMPFEWFPHEVPAKPSGYYAHMLMLRITDSYALFQTDGELNTARIRAGEQVSNFVSRIEIFKRKQTTPERLTGRELLRRYGFLSPEPSTDRRTRVDAQGLPTDTKKALREAAVKQFGILPTRFDRQIWPLVFRLPQHRPKKNVTK